MSGSLLSKKEKEKIPGGLRAESDARPELWLVRETFVSQVSAPHFPSWGGYVSLLWFAESDLRWTLRGHQIVHSSVVGRGALAPAAASRPEVQAVAGAGLVHHVRPA